MMNKECERLKKGEKLFPIDASQSGNEFKFKIVQTPFLFPNL